ncbi:hypothetical protein EG68_09579 [Paragonimus skrjabini miyazakii]|uniref:ELM2 domain-containing protein n=1 Tax=Paragonimus skrjabini miyazakii TaxID=59628 RepID=A0A8S9YAA5_9TREM|nr:hypothetical protein EG68_09579 [Paragonimus skrjabini miyazakii]
MSNHAAETLKDEGGESKDSDHDDGFPSRFWQRAIGAGESPPSYNFDENEDDAPSLESRLDWKGEIRVGEEYQPGKLLKEVVHFERLFALTVMSPLPNERTVDEEEALFLLMCCNYDPDEAHQRLRFRTVSPAEIPGYMEADSTAFEKGFAPYNKDLSDSRNSASAQESR